MADPILLPISEAGHNASKVFVGVTVPLYAAALATITARMVFKLRSGVRFGVDDGLIAIGFLLATTDWCMLMVAIVWNLDSSLAFTTLDTAQHSIMLGTTAIPIWGFSLGFIKTSVACQLLRFQQNSGWRRFLYAFIVAVVIVTIGSCIFSIVQCIPLAAVWDHSILGAKCASPNTVRGVSNFVGAFSITSDIILSLFPLTFLVKLRRPVIEKILISILMAVGLTASAASIMKAVIIEKWIGDPDGFYVGFTLSTLATCEMVIGSLAACLPCLKPTIQRLLSACGVNFESDFSTSPAFFRSLGQVLTPKNSNPEVAQRDITPAESAQSDSSNLSTTDAEKGEKAVPEVT